MARHGNKTPINGYCLILEYDFKKLDSTNCIPRGEEFISVVEAKNECKRRGNCKGVLNPDCKEPSNVYLCNATATTRSDSYIKSCFYQKYRSGETSKEYSTKFCRK